MKRAITLLELLIVLSLISIIIPFLATKIPQWKAHYSFSQDCTLVEEMLFDAELLAILTTKTTEVRFVKEPYGCWQVSLEPYEASVGFQRAHILQETQEVQSQGSGEVVIQFSAPFGETNDVPVLLSSYGSKTYECGLAIPTVVENEKSTLFTDSLLNALENGA